MRVAVIGTVGIPASYGGFETLVQNLAQFRQKVNVDMDMLIFCSARHYKVKPNSIFGAELRYLPLSANGVSSIPYDILSVLKAVLSRSDTLLVLGVSGALVLPLVRYFGKVRVVINIDGIEWRRDKWRGIARWFLRFSEGLAVRYSDVIIADNAAIGSYIKEHYGVTAEVIAYGGDHAIEPSAIKPDNVELPAGYAFSVCRIEPENNIHLILSAFSNVPDIPLVLVGNWGNSNYGLELRSRYGKLKNLRLLDPIYDSGVLKYLRANARVYVHGHSAGGTNPSLVEAMHFGLPILAFDCEFNRSTTESLCLFFKDEHSLLCQLKRLDHDLAKVIGEKMKLLADSRYTWHVVAEQYFGLLTRRL